MDEKTLENLGIFELRDLARKVGVFNPTVLKKNELISQICDIQSGKIKPYISKTKQGRPPKQIGGYEKLVEIFLPNDITELPTKEESIFSRYDNTLMFHSAPDESEESSGQVTYKGYLEELENGSGLLRPRTIRQYEQRDFVYVSNRMMTTYKLRSGDEIVCRANLIRQDRAMVLIDIIEINGVPFDEYFPERNSFKNLPCNLSSRNIDLNFDTKDKLNFNIKYGDTIFVYSNREEEFDMFLTQFIQDNEKCFDSIVYLCPMLTNKDYERLKTKKAEVYATDFESPISYQQKTAFLAYNRARRLAESGKEVLFVIDNAMSMMGLDKDISGDFLISKKLLSTAKNFAVGSLTIMLSVPPLNYKIMNNLFYSTFPIVETVGLAIKNNKIDIKESYRK